MIVITGFDNLLKKYEELPDVGWLYIETTFDFESEADIANGKYYISENDDEEMDFEENYDTFLEAPIFKAIIENKLGHHPKSKKEELLEAVVYYLENDDFLD
ncbi:hypothetical protein [Yersinia sp. IP36721]|uniref:DUF7716 domain-containing protein n=1 Tax=Yersinia sp. IP36721 TaxID=2161716 RepID=UPI000EB1453E|nr:hypothetical protein [Yersinia sp. IP36721]